MSPEAKPSGTYFEDQGETKLIVIDLLSFVCPSVSCDMVPSNRKLHFM